MKSALTAIATLACIFAATPVAVAETLTPKMAGSLPLIPRSAWKIDAGGGGRNVQVYLFCQSGRWEVVSSQRGSLALMGTYKVQGDTIISKDGNGGAVTNYKMTWNGTALELNDGKVVLKLIYNGETKCK